MLTSKLIRACLEIPTLKELVTDDEVLVKEIARRIKQLKAMGYPDNEPVPVAVIDTYVIPKPNVWGPIVRVERIVEPTAKHLDDDVKAVVTVSDKARTFFKKREVPTEVILPQTVTPKLEPKPMAYVPSIRELRPRNLPAGDSWCPKCRETGPIDTMFGMRNIKRAADNVVRVQSLCRKCRKESTQTTRNKRKIVVEYEEF